MSPDCNYSEIVPCRYERLAANVVQALPIKDLPFQCWLSLFILCELAGFALEFNRARTDAAAFSMMGWLYPIAKGSAQSMKVGPHNRSCVIKCFYLIYWLLTPIFM